MPAQGVGVVPPHQADAPGNSNIRLRESGWKLEKGEGTLKDVSNLIKGTGSENYKTVRYFDVEANGFRSFKVENLITIY
jgi:hypothetical protein